MREDLTILFYTSNNISDNFMAATTGQLIKAADGTPIVSVSQKPMDLGKNICVGNLGQHVWNIYHQMLIGANAAKTKYVATAEDDVLYSREHYHDRYPDDDTFMFDLNRWSLFTWKRPMFSYKPDRMVGHQMICERKLLIKVLEERFRKYPRPITVPLEIFGEPGRYEKKLKVSVNKTQVFYSGVPSIIFNHEVAVGYLQIHGRRKADGPLKTEMLPDWGTAKEVMEWIR